MNPFERSAYFYDDLYEGKNYAAEAGYVDTLIQSYSPGARALLDLGCGTGRHAIEFTGKGYSVVGVDRSLEMIARAIGRRDYVSSDIRERLAFQHGDIRDLRLDRHFDAVVALFHVVSYQISNDDLLAALTTARAHLRENGVFIFDCWYGPGVLTDPPAVRVKRLQRGFSQLLRIAEPAMRINENLVDIHHNFVITAPREECSEFKEMHTMRYFFAPELALALERTGLKLVAVAEWMSGREPDGNTWYVSAVTQPSI